MNMSKIEIKTLTPIHIGSGRELSNNTEFLYFNDQKLFAVVDEHKILDIIGEENINQWANIISENGSLLEYLLQRKRLLEPNHIAQRMVKAQKGQFSQFKTLKEQLHDGRALPYIPGSSIKGAIRTAITATKALDNKRLASNNLKEFNKRKHKEVFNAQLLEKKLFGDNPNKDIFRFLQVGDAYFEKSTTAMRANILNLYGNKKWEYKRDGHHLVECIPADSSTFFRIKTGNTSLQRQQIQNDVMEFSIHQLFDTIREHSRSLIEKEIHFWEDEIEATRYPESVDQMMETLNWLYDEIKSCSPEETILRIGFGSGWKFITGGWAIDRDIMNDRTYYDFLRNVRKKNYPNDIPFPKSRKITEEGNVLGFVKLRKI